MEKVFRFRIYPTDEQKKQILKTIGCVRLVYNDALDSRKIAWDVACINLNFYWTCRALTSLKKQKPFLKDVDKFALQNALKDLDRAYKNFFAGRANYPKFKRKHSSKQNYRTNFTNNNIAVDDKSVKLPKLGKVKAKISRSIEGRIFNATVSYSKSGKYFVSICCTNVEIQKLPLSKREIGIDLGIKNFAIISDGGRIPSPKYLRRSLDRLKMLQRRLSRKSSDSRNREKARIRLSKLHEHISNQRGNFLHQLTTHLVRNYDLICIEDLNICGMMKNHRLAQAIGDIGIGKFILMLEYKARWYGKKIQKVNRFYPSSQICSECGYRNPNLKDLSIREWQCSECGAYHDRDINAARNILQEGKRLFEQTVS